MFQCFLSAVCGFMVVLMLQDEVNHPGIDDYSG